MRRAYETLSSPDRRAFYDRHGREPPTDDDGPQPPPGYDGPVGGTGRMDCPDGRLASTQLGQAFERGNPFMCSRALT